MGVAFAFGWTPCVGPVLAAILTMAASGRRPGGRGRAPVRLFSGAGHTVLAGGLLRGPGASGLLPDTETSAGHPDRVRGDPGDLRSSPDRRAVQLAFGAAVGPGVAVLLSPKDEVHRRNGVSSCAVESSARARIAPGHRLIWCGTRRSRSPSQERLGWGRSVISCDALLSVRRGGARARAAPVLVSPRPRCILPPSRPQQWRWTR